MVWVSGNRIAPTSDGGVRDSPGGAPAVRSALQHRKGMKQSVHFAQVPAAAVPMALTAANVAASPSVPRCAGRFGYLRYTAGETSGHFWLLRVFV
jgi:hypothetical protein